MVAKRPELVVDPKIQQLGKRVAGLGVVIAIGEAAPAEGEQLGVSIVVDIHDGEIALIWSSEVVDLRPEDAPGSYRIAPGKSPDGLQTGAMLPFRNTQSLK